MDGLRGNKGKGGADLKEWNTKGGRGGMDSRAEQQQLDELHAAWVMPGFRTTKAAMHSRFTCKLQQYMHVQTGAARGFVPFCQTTK